MARRLTALLVALAIALLGPSFADGNSRSGSVELAAVAQCCPNADYKGPDCPDQGNRACDAALACTAQCGAAVPMLAARDLVPLPAPAQSESSAIGRSDLLASVSAPPPLKPPKTSILI
jgi:hypothetical protein